MQIDRIKIDSPTEKANQRKKKKKGQRTRVSVRTVHKNWGVVWKLNHLQSEIFRAFTNCYDYMMTCKSKMHFTFLPFSSIIIKLVRANNSYSISGNTFYTELVSTYSIIQSRSLSI